MDASAEAGCDRQRGTERTINQHRHPARHPIGRRAALPGSTICFVEGCRRIAFTLSKAIQARERRRSGLQFLLEGVRQGESCMYITLSETAEELRVNAASHGWDLSGIHIQELQPAENLRPEEQYTLFHPSEIELGDLSRNVFEAVEKFKPARAVLDSVSDMRLLARDSLRYRRQILGLKQFFAGRGCTLMLLNETGVSDTDAHIQSLAHGVIRLEQSVHDFGIARRRLEIVKMRGVAYVGGFHDFRIQTGGMRVFPRLENRRQNRPLPNETLEERPSASRRAAGQRRADGHLHADSRTIGSRQVDAQRAISRVGRRKGHPLRGVPVRRATPDLPRSRRRCSACACRSTQNTTC